MPDQSPVVLVTGAARRIGACIATEFHQQGCRVIVHYHHSEADARQLIDGFNNTRANSASMIQADLTDASQVSRLAELAAQAFGQLNYLVNNASSFYPTTLAESTQQQWDDLVDSNLRSAYFLSKALAPALQEQRGAIINLVDSHADSALAGFPIYSIAKAGVKAMTKALAKELAPHVRVNGVSPGAILWPESLLDDTDPEVQLAREKILAGIPLGKTGSAQQIADAAWFFAACASYVTGQVVKVDGGRSLTA